MDIQHLQNYLQAFADARDWNQFHTPKNLSMALAGECGELLEIFQWLEPGESMADKLGPLNRQAVKDEIADVFIYTIRLAAILNIDLEEVFWEKMKKNGQKYPPGEQTSGGLGFNQ